MTWPICLFKGLRLRRGKGTQMRRTVLRMEEIWNGLLLVTSDNVRVRTPNLCSATVTGAPSDPGRRVLLAAGKAGGFCGACLAQQGCWSQGISAGEGITNTAGTNRE